MAIHLWKWCSWFIPKSSSQYLFFLKFWNEQNCEPLLSQSLPGGLENSNGYEQLLLSYKWKQQFNTRYLNCMKTTFKKCLNLLKESVYGFTRTAQNFLKVDQTYPPTSNASTVVRRRTQLPHSAIDQVKIQKVSYILCADFHTCLSSMRLKDIKIETQFTVLFGYTWYGEWLWSGFDARCVPKKPVCCGARGTINLREREFLHSLQQNLEGSTVNSTDLPAALYRVLSPPLNVLRITSHLLKSK